MSVKKIVSPYATQYEVDSKHSFSAPDVLLERQGPDRLAFWVRKPVQNGYVNISVTDLLSVLKGMDFLSDPELDEKVERLADILLAAGLPDDAGLEDAARKMLKDGTVTLP